MDAAADHRLPTIRHTEAKEGDFYVCQSEDSNAAPIPISSPSLTLPSPCPVTPSLSIPSIIVVANEEATKEEKGEEEDVDIINLILSPTAHHSNDANYNEKEEKVEYARRTEEVSRAIYASYDTLTRLILEHLDMLTEEKNTTRPKRKHSEMTPKQEKEKTSPPSVRRSARLARAKRPGRPSKRRKQCIDDDDNAESETTMGDLRKALLGAYQDAQLSYTIIKMARDRLHRYNG